ncbi:hypothetical protein QJS10_CPA16g00642 [Acorus calamus]|uniref:Uncharacterized protein n=1 Tax=Acorus calamus TaxID=4465 RepID=A0AAV9D2D5_ACOCL|nr:hypothetical protein QJS10_CPA16g00642 [Acorus calamus]
MSRCFPFPPPGYEKKPRNEIDLLTKEKQTEKKHKKEKKEREKKEGKEKKDKDRNKDKYKEKKDRKEKHKDKKKDKDREKDKSRSSDEKKAGQTKGVHCAEKLGNSWQSADGTTDSKFTEELARRIQDGDQVKGSQMVGNSSVAVQRKMEGTCTTMEREPWNKKEGKDKRKESKADDKKAAADNHSDKNGGNSIEMVQNLKYTEQRRFQRLGGPLEKDKIKVEGKEAEINRETDDKKGAWHKDQAREEKKAKGKDKERDKTKEKGEHKHKEHDKFREIKKKETINNSTMKPPFTVKYGGEGDGNVTNLKKRKEFEANGFLHENDKRPAKLPKQDSSSTHLSLENGRKLEPCHIAIECASNGQGESLVDNKDHKANGIIDGYSSQHNSRPLLSMTEAIENGEASTRPPHPDSKYLDQIYAVPKTEEWPEIDDQDWLFGSGWPEIKPKATPDPDETPEVWSKALHIESADVWALPYVIPY